jgi:hypothetical protein
MTCTLRQKMTCTGCPDCISTMALLNVDKLDDVYQDALASLKDAEAKNRDRNDQSNALKAEMLNATEQLKSVGADVRETAKTLSTLKVKESETAKNRNDLTAKYKKSLEILYAADGVACDAADWVDAVRKAKDLSAKRRIRMEDSLKAMRQEALATLKDAEAKGCDLQDQSSALHEEMLNAIEQLKSAMDAVVIASVTDNNPDITALIAKALEAAKKRDELTVKHQKSLDVLYESDGVTRDATYRADALLEATL